MAKGRNTRNNVIKIGVGCFLRRTELLLREKKKKKQTTNKDETKQKNEAFLGNSIVVLQPLELERDIRSPRGVWEERAVSSRTDSGMWLPPATRGKV